MCMSTINKKVLFFIQYFPFQQKIIAKKIERVIFVYFLSLEGNEEGRRLIELNTQLFEGSKYLLNQVPVSLFHSTRAEGGLRRL